jgi:hypothetical protein
MFSTPFMKNAVFCAILAYSTPLIAQQNEDDMEQLPINEVALELSHPATSFVYMDNRFEFRDYQGNLSDAAEQSAWSYEFETVWPIELNNGKNLQFRATIPINADQSLYEMGKKDFPEWKIRQYADVLPQDSYFKRGHDHLDDIELDAAYSGVSDTGLITLFGARLVLPTSQDFSSARDQYLLGPEVALGKVTSWGVFGATASHVTDIGGDADYSTNMSAVDVFFSWGFGNGWQIVSNPKIEYDWEGADDNKLLLPVGAGIARTFRIRRTAVKLNLELYNYVESPEAYGPEWLLRFNLTPVLFTP